MGIRVSLTPKGIDWDRYETAANGLTQPPFHPQWVVEPLIPANTVTVIGGDPNTFKSWLGLYTSIAVSTGSPVFGRFPTTKGPVRYFNGDDEESDVLYRIHRLVDGCWGKALDRKMQDLMNFHLSQVDDPTCLIDTTPMKDRKGKPITLLGGFENTLKGYKLCILDPQIQFSVGLDENDSSDMQTFFGTLRGVARRTRCAIVLLHHLRKGQPEGRKKSKEGEYAIETERVMERLRGSGAIRGAARCCWAVQAEEDEPVVHIKIESRYAARLNDLRVKFEIDDKFARVTCSGGESVNNQRSTAAAILGYLRLHPKTTITQVSTTLGIEYDTINKALQRMYAQQQVRVETDPKNKGQKLWSADKPRTH